MPYIQGQNSGITGTIILDDGTQPFCGKCYGFARVMDGKVEDFPGRGDDIWGDPRLVGVGGTLLVRFMAQPGKGFPMPADFTGATGAIILQLNKVGDTIVNETVQVQVTSHKMKRDDGDPKGDTVAPATDNWVGTLTCRITAMPAEAGFSGSQDPGTAPTYDDKELYAGTSKTLDQKSIQDAATRAYLIWPIADTDAAEMTKLQDLVATAVADDDPTGQGLKVRPAGLSRVNYAAVRVTIAWGWTDTQDDWVLPRIQVKDDPNKISSGGTVAGMDSTPDLPTISGQTLVSRGTTPTTLHDGKIGYTTEVGQRSTVDDIQMDESQENVDEAGLNSDGQKTVVFAAGDDPPDDAVPVDASLQAVGYTVQEINLDESKKATRFKVNKSDEQWIYDHVRSSTDPSNIKNLTILGAVFVRGSEPDVPDAPDGLVFNHKELFELSSPNTSNKQGVLWFFSETTSADDVIFDHAKAVTDPQGINSSKIVGAIFTTGTSPDDPSVPTGLKIVSYIDTPLTDADASNQSLRLYAYGKLDSLDEIKVPKQKTVVDANHINDEAVRTKEWLSNGTPPAAPTDAPGNNVKLITYTDLEIYPVIGSTPGLNLRVFLYGAKDSRDEVILPNDETTTDESTLVLESTAIRAYLDGDSVPSTPSGLTLVSAKARPLTLSLGTNRTLTVLIYGLSTAQQKKETEQLQTAIDNGNDLDDRAIRTKLWLASGSAPTGPDHVPTNNVKLIGYHDAGVPENPLLLLRVWVYGPQDSADKLKIGSPFLRHRLGVETDASGLSSTAITTFLDGDTPPDAPVDDNSVVLVETRRYDQPQTIGLGVNRILTIVEYGTITDQQKMEFRESEASADNLVLSESREVTIVDWTDTDDALATSIQGANQADLTFLKAHATLWTPGKAKLTIERRDEDLQILPGSAHVVEQLVNGVPSTAVVAGPGINPGAISYGDATGALLVFVPGPALLLGGYTTVTIKGIPIWRGLGTFQILRIYADDDFSDHLNLAIIGNTNSDTFCGHVAGEVMYAGPISHFNLNLSGSRRRGLVYQFYTDNYKWFSAGLMPAAGKAYPNAPLASAGFYTSADFDPGYGPIWPPTTTFSGFIS